MHRRASRSEALAPTIRLISQGARFGVVGMVATAVHAAVYLLLAGGLGYPTVLANLAAYAVAVSVSFLGSRHWTFRDAGALSAMGAGSVFARFVLVSLSGLAMNIAIAYLVVDVLAGPHLVAVALMVTIVPAATFVAQKFWVFESRARR